MEVNDGKVRQTSGIFRKFSTMRQHSLASVPDIDLRAMEEACLRDLQKELGDAIEREGVLRIQVEEATARLTDQAQEYNKVIKEQAPRRNLGLLKRLFKKLGDYQCKPYTDNLARLPEKTQFKISHNFGYADGHRYERKPELGPGATPLMHQKVLYSHSVDPVRYDPSLTYGRTRPYVPPKFQPHFILYANKCLTFRAFFKQSVPESPDENFRVRIVNIIYFLEDDTITVMEPKVENAGFLQGKIVKRGKVPKNDVGDYWHWKDFEIGMDMEIYGIVYHICSCDNYTRAWLESQGVELGEEEELPFDPYQLKRRQICRPQPLSATPTQYDNLKKYLEFDKRVLRFYAVWDSRHEEYGELGKYILHYYLVDDTMDIIQVPKKDQIQLFRSSAILKKQKVPKNWKELPADYCPLVHERTDADVRQYYGPEDLIVGKTVFMLGRRFYIYDCDAFTRRYYKNVYHIDQPKVELPEDTKPQLKVQQPLPPYTGFGTHEDSILSHYYVDPISVQKVNKMDFIRYVQNTNKKLRYTAVMEEVHPEDAGRQFIIEYRISDGNIQIHELRQRNSGFTGGCFLKYTLVPKPGTNPDNPEYYTPPDFHIGAVIEVFGHRFVVTGVGLSVYRYMEANPEKFPANLVAEARRNLAREGDLADDVRDLADFKRREEVEEPVMPEGPAQH